MLTLKPRNPRLMAGRAVVALALVAGTLVTQIACDHPDEIAALEAILGEVREELFELQRVANQLNVYRRDVAALEAGIEEGMGVFAGEGPSSDELSAMVDGARISADREGEEGSWSIALSGNGGAVKAARVIAEFAELAPSMQVRDVSVDGDSWTASARIEGIPVKEASAWQPKEYQLPPATWRSKEKAEELRADIQRTQAEIRQLCAIIDPVVDLRRRADDYRAYLAALDRNFAAGKAADLLGRLMAADGAPLPSGKLVFGDEAVTVTMGGHAAGSSAEALTEALGEGWRVEVLEQGDRAVFRAHLCRDC